MENLSKKIITALITLVLFLISFILFHNDLINYFIISITLTLILFIYLCIIVFVKKKEKNDYDKRLSKILKIYDSLLVYSDTNYNIEDETITFVKRIDDLVRYCDELNKTIIYIEEEESGTFIVKTDVGLLVYIMKKYDYSRSEMEQKIHNYLKDKDDNNE